MLSDWLAPTLTVIVVTVVVFRIVRAFFRLGIRLIALVLRFAFCLLRVAVLGIAWLVRRQRAAGCVGDEEADVEYDDEYLAVAA